MELILRHLRIVDPSLRITAKYINTDGSVPAVAFVYIPSQDILGLTGDPLAITQAAGDGEEVVRLPRSYYTRVGADQAQTHQEKNFEP